MARRTVVYTLLPFCLLFVPACQGAEPGGEAVPALRAAGILPAVGNKGKMPSPREEATEQALYVGWASASCWFFRKVDNLFMVQLEIDYEQPTGKIE